LIVSACLREVYRRDQIRATSLAFSTPERFRRLLDISEVRKAVESDAAVDLTDWDRRMAALQEAVLRSYADMDSDLSGDRDCGSRWEPAERIVDTIELHRLQLMWREWIPGLSKADLDGLYTRAKGRFPKADVVRPEQLLTAPSSFFGKRG
jgi:hypothetical protein